MAQPKISGPKLPKLPKGVGATPKMPTGPAAPRMRMSGQPKMNVKAPRVPKAPGMP